MKRQSYLYRMVAAALLLGLILLFGLTPLGMWNFGVVYITLLCVPVIIGTLALGLRWGLLLAFGFGTVSLITGLRSPSGLVAPILSANVVWLVILCYVPRLIVPVTTYLTQQLVAKKNTALLAIPSAVGSLTNTILYLGFILIMYWLIGIDRPGFLATLGGIVLAGGLPEAAVAAIICPAVVLALKKAHLA